MSADAAPDQVEPPGLSSGKGVEAGLGLSLLLLVLVAGLGASAVEPRLPGAGHLPPWTLLGARPDSLGVVVLVIAALVTGGLALARAVRAAAHDWRPRPSRLVAAGILAVVAMSLVPATGSADPESYAAYGRMVELGRDPYTTTPAQLVRIGDPIAAAVEDPWKDTASVYGPLATAEQRFASSIGHRSVRTTVVVLVVANGIAFVLTGLVLVAAAGSEAGRRRAALLWMLNPLLLWELVSGAHLDALVALGCVAGVVLVPKSRLAAGALLGCAAAVKLPALAVVAGVLWSCRHSRRNLAEVLLGTGGVLAVSYATVSSHAIGRSLHAGQLASWATPWRAGISLLDATVGRPGSRTLMSVIALAVALAFAVALLRKESSAPQVTIRSAATAGFCCYFSYLLAAPYALPWYDAPAWGLLVLMAPSVYDLLLTARTTALAAAYVTHDDPHLTSPAHAVVIALRNVVSPIVLTAVLLWTVALVRRPSPPPG
ncbi:MAG: alpha,6-mannosyltransferase [Frankiales bacterium]|nr:alpha,6-mannosyltransferase [Frankiales bacterium]